MGFDDFDYDLYNKYILIDPERDENDPASIDLGGFVPQPATKNKNGAVEEDEQSLPLTEQQVDRSVQESETNAQNQYNHTALDVTTHKERENAAIMAAIERKQALKQKQLEEEQQRLEKIKAHYMMEDSAQEFATGPNEAEYGNEDDQEEDEIEYDVFYSSAAIQKTLIQQDQNLFVDIEAHKKDIIGEFRGVNNLKQKMNKFLIEDWAPKEE